MSLLFEAVFEQLEVDLGALVRDVGPNNASPLK
jgi:hypothetical protein